MPVLPGWLAAFAAEGSSTAASMDGCSTHLSRDAGRLRVYVLLPIRREAEGVADYVPLFNALWLLGCPGGGVASEYEVGQLLRESREWARSHEEVQPSIRGNLL